MESLDYSVTDKGNSIYLFLRRKPFTLRTSVYSNLMFNMYVWQLRFKEPESRFQRSSLVPFVLFPICQHKLPTPLSLNSNYSLWLFNLSDLLHLFNTKTSQFSFVFGFIMPSIASSRPLSVNRSQISSIYLSSNGLSANLVLLKSRSIISGASALAFSPLQKNNKVPSPIELGSKISNFAGWSQLLRQRSVEFPLPEAAASADANGGEFDISDGFETYYSCLSNL